MKNLCIILFVLAIVITTQTVVYAAESVSQKTVKVTFSTGTRTVTAVYVDLNDKNIRMESVLSNNQIGKSDELKNIAQSVNSIDCEAVAAINGTFFNSYTDQMPWGNIQSKGQFINTGSTGSVIGFTTDNSVLVDNLSVSVIGGIKGSWDYPNQWYAWGFNQKSDNPDAIYIFTPAFGSSTGPHKKTSVVVDNGIIIKISKGAVAIPSTGYVIVLEAADILKRFHVGDTVDYKLNFSKLDFSGKNNTGPIKWENVRTTVGAGPTIVKDGKVTADGKLEGFIEAKINTERNQRSFIGVTSGNTLIMGTVPDVTLKELGEITKKLGVINGINLDGGASSGLYYKNSYLTTPGRKLSNVIVVTKLKQPPLRLQVNGKEAIYDTDIYLTGKQSSVMVPLIGLCKTLGAVYTLDGKSKSIIIKKNITSIEIKINSNIVKINGSEQKLDTNIIAKNGRTYIPLDLMIKAFGGIIKEDKSKYIVTASINAVNVTNLIEQANQANDSGKTDKAIELYTKIIELDPNNPDSRLKLARIYNKKKDFEKAIFHFNEYLKIIPNEADVLYQLGWCYYSSGGFENKQKAAEVFEKLTILKPSNVDYLIALGDCYESWDLKEYQKAKECFNKALKLKPSASQLENINKQLTYVDKMLK
jgi:hypothetical protein